jgi:hypothetical protein
MNELNDGIIYAVFRNGVRVSDTEYPDPFFAQAELKRWQDIVKKYPDGSKVEVLPINNQ